MTDEIKELFYRIQPCDTEKPYAFISYSHADGEYVWQDALKLQEQGYNIWIDRTVNPTEEKSWDEKTAEVISAFNCRMVLFYTSKHSVTSTPCFNEILACESSQAKNTHMRSAVPVLKIDVAPIADMVQFETDVNRAINALDIPSGKKDAMARALSGIFDHCFPNGNSNVRMLSRTDPKRELDYYRQLEETLTRAEVDKANPEERFRRCFRLLSDPTAYRGILQELKYLDERCNDFHASLLRAYLLDSGLCGIQDAAEADQLLSFASLMSPEDQWITQANDCVAFKENERAIALYLGHGLLTKNAGSFLGAARLLIPKEKPKAFYPFAKDCLTRAVQLGDPNAPKLLKGLEQYILMKQNNH